MNNKFEQNLELLSELHNVCIKALDSDSESSTVEISEGFWLTRIETERMITVLKKLSKSKNEEELEETIKKEYNNISKKIRRMESQILKDVDEKSREKLENYMESI